MWSYLEDFRSKHSPLKYTYLKSVMFSKFIYFNGYCANILWLVSPVLYCRQDETQDYQLCKEIEVCSTSPDYYIGTCLTRLP